MYAQLVCQGGGMAVIGMLSPRSFQMPSLFEALTTRV